MLLNKYLLLICFSFIYSFQGIFINDNANHMALSGSYEVESDANSKNTFINGSASYVLNSGLELIVNAAKGTFDAKDLPDEYDFGANVFGGGAIYYVKNVAPVNFMVGATYDMLNVVDYELLEELDGEMKATNISYGGGVYKTVSSGPGYEITPYVGYYLNNMQFELTAPGESYDNDDLGIDGEGSTIHFGLGIKFGQLTIRPTITSSDGNNDFNLTVGFIL